MRCGRYQSTVRSKSLTKRNDIFEKYRSDIADNNVKNITKVVTVTANLATEMLITSV